MQKKRKEGKEKEGRGEKGDEGREEGRKERKSHWKIFIMLITHKELPSKIHGELQINKKMGKR